MSNLICDMTVRSFVGSVETCAVGAVGATLLVVAGYPGVVVLEAIKMGAAGGAIVGGVRGALENFGVFAPAYEKNWFQKALENSVFTVGGGVVGQVVMNAVAPTVMNLTMTAAAFAVGVPALAVYSMMNTVLLLGAILCGLGLAFHYHVALPALNPF